MQILDVAVGEPGIPELIPGAKAKTNAKPKHHRHHKRRHHKRRRAHHR
jgi:hypothetical protein